MWRCVLCAALRAKRRGSTDAAARALRCDVGGGGGSADAAMLSIRAGAMAGGHDGRNGRAGAHARDGVGEAKSIGKVSERRGGDGDSVGRGFERVFLFFFY